MQPHDDEKRRDSLPIGTGTGPPETTSVGAVDDDLPSPDAKPDVGPSGRTPETAESDTVSLLAEALTKTSPSKSASPLLFDAFSSTNVLTGAQLAIRNDISAQTATASGKIQSSAAQSAAKMAADAIGPGSAMRAAIVAQNTLASSVISDATHAAINEVLRSTAGLTGATSALRAAQNASSTLAAAGISNSISRAMSEIVRDSIASAGWQGGVQAALRSADLPYSAGTIAALRAVSAGETTAETDARFVEGWRTGAGAQKYFKSIPKEPSSKGQEPVSADAFFSENEIEVKSLADLHAKIDRLVTRNPGLALVWRGHQDASWGLHSTLFRVLTRFDKVGSSFYPTEEQMVEAEKRILGTAREEWRLNDMSSLEIFARLQHLGAPTRLLDVSRNPLIATWFAVESGVHNEKDGRLVALATGSVPVDASTTVPFLSLSASDLSQAGEPVWHAYTTPEERRSAGWGTGGNRLVWIPSVYEERISAQNAGFVLDGTPIVSTEVLNYFESKSELALGPTDILAAGSIYVHTQKATRKALRSGPAFAPTFTFRIPKTMKEEIRIKLENNYSLSRGTIYPDMAGLARYVAADYARSQPQMEPATVD